MANLLTFTAEIWRKRFFLLIPVILGGLLGGLYSIGKTPVYEATTTLHLKPAQVSFPLLQHIKGEEQNAILRRTLASERVLEDSLQEVGLLLEGTDPEERRRILNETRQRLELKVLPNSLIRINYQSENKSTIKQVLETISINFIYEILAPERFRVEQQLSILENQVKRYGEQAKKAEEKLKAAENMPWPTDKDETKQEKLRHIVSLEFNLQRLQAQRQLAQEEYDRLLARSKGLMVSYDISNPGSMTWFVEPPVIISPDISISSHIYCFFYGMLYGLLAGIAMAFLSHFGNTSIRHDEEVEKHLNSKVLGHLPNFGNLTLIYPLTTSKKAN